MAFDVKFNTTELTKLQDKLNRLNSDLDDRRDALQLIGIRWVGMIKSNISKGIDVNGVRFNSVSYTKYRYDNGTGTRYSSKMFRDVNPLQDTGRLVGSIMVTDVDANSVTVGTNVEYADTHNEGIGFVKKREFIPRSNNSKGYKTFVREAQKTLDLWVEEKIRNVNLD